MSMVKIEGIYYAKIEGVYKKEQKKCICVECENKWSCNTVLFITKNTYITDCPRFKKPDGLLGGKS